LKRINDGSLDAADEDGSGTPRSPASREAIKNFTSQVYIIFFKFWPEMNLLIRIS
jgi:hypothetical protein